MNKRGIFKYIFIFAAAFISFYFMIKTSEVFENMLNITLVILFLVALTIYMYFNKNKVKKNKFAYDVTLMLMMVFSALFMVYFIYSIISCLLNPACGDAWNSLFLGIYPILLFLMLMFGIKDMKHKTNKTNDVLTIVSSSLIILVHLIYYLEPNFIHKLNSTFFIYSFDYISQYYVYFVIMYFVVLVHYRVNKIK